MGRHGMEGYALDGQYVAEYVKKKGKKKAYYKVHIPGIKDHCTCGPNIFKKYFKLLPTGDVKRGVLRKKPITKVPLPMLLKAVLKNTDLTIPEIERVFELRPFGYINKQMKAKKEQPELRALLMILLRFPWMADVADNNFKADHAKRVMIARGGYEMIKFAKKM